jgi:beta-phosphoglucomutase-like phosphatase (HAD superfamily)
MLDTVFFELDGVLADTAEVRRDALLSTLRADGVMLYDGEYRLTCAGLATEDAIRAAWALCRMPTDDTAISLAAVRAERAYRAFLGKGLTLAEGARETLERLGGVARLGLVTRASRAEAEFVLSLARMDHTFTCVIASEDTAAGKPSPAPYRAALARIDRVRGANPRGVIVALEDALPGVHSARGAGILCVMVGDVPAHVALEADACLRSVAGLTPDTLLALVARKNEPII